MNAIRLSAMLLAALLVAALAGTCWAATITPGVRVDGTIAVAGEMDPYEFYAEAGSGATILMGESAGSLWPQVELHAPDGALVATEWGFESATIEAQPLDQTGTWVIICRDYYGTGTGGYGVTVIVTPGAYTDIEIGSPETGTIAPGDLHAYTFSGEAGDAATILMGESTGSLWPQVELHAPDGTLVATDWGFESATIEAQPLDQTGTWVIICRDYYGTEVGGYGVTLIKNPGGLETIQSGETKFPDITVGDLDGYAFWGEEGDAATILIAESVGSLWPQVELHAPDGTLVATEWGFESATIEAQPLDQTGTWVIICRDYYGTETGGYGVSLFKNPGSPNSVQDPDGGWIESGTTLLGTISVGDLDACLFWGYCGDAATVLMGESASSLWPQVELHAPDGTVVATDWGFESATIEAQPLDQTGWWAIVCRDYYGTETGDYSVSLVKNPANPVYFDDDHCAITYTGTWSQLAHPAASGGHVSYSKETGATAELVFYGTGAKWALAMGPMMGKANVYLDDGYIGQLDLYRWPPRLITVGRGGLALGLHTVTIEVSGQKRPASSGYFVDVDAFEVIP